MKNSPTVDLTVAVRRDQGFPAAQRLLVNHHGRDVMDIIRAEVETMPADERAGHDGDDSPAACRRCDCHHRAGINAVKRLTNDYIYSSLETCNAKK